MSILNEIESVSDVLAVDLKRGAKMLGVSDRHFGKQLDINGGPIRTRRMGTRVLIPVESLREYLKAPAAEAKPVEAKPEKKSARRRA
jgi:hypothetical protein